MTDQEHYEMQLSAIKGILQTCHNNPCIVELGAHHGEDTHWMIQACPVPPKLVLVEPDLENFRDLLERKYNASMIHGAIADHDGVCDFWVCHSTDGRGSGSIRDPAGHIASKPWMNFERKENYCPCFTLDTLYARENLDHIDLLWVDIQGAEGDMIAHGQNALRHTRYLMMEAEQAMLYEGQVLRDGLLAMLPGWTMIGDFEINVLLRNDNDRDH